jgi:hypothetical protein
VQVILGTMKTPADVRYQSGASDLVAAQRVVFPLEVAVRKPTHGAAFSAARSLITQFEAEIAQLKVGKFDIQANSIRFELDPKGNIVLQLSCSLVLSLGGEPVFWSRAEAITRTLDLIQRYCTPGKESNDTAVYTGPAQIVNGQPANGA